MRRVGNEVGQAANVGLAPPDTVIDVIRVLYDGVLDLDPEVGNVLAALHPLG